MNQWKYLLGLLLPLLLACSRAGEHEALFKQVENIVNERPDSAMMLLETIQNPERLPERDWAYWALLTTQAKDKLYIRHTSDSVINRVVDYFDGFAFFQYRHEKALAYFYKGRVHEDLVDRKKAFAAYKRASGYVWGTGDDKLTYLIESYLGDIYVHQNVNNFALEHFERAHKAAVRSKDSANIAYTLIYLARAHGKQEEWEQAKTNYKQVLEIAKRIKNINILFSGTQELASVYVRTDSLSSALNLMKRLIKVEAECDIAHDFSTDLVMGNIYRKMCQADSALPYLKKAIGSENIHTRHSTYQALYHLYLDEDSLSQALKYNELVNACADSIEAMGTSSDSFQIEADSNKKIIIVLILISIVLIGIIFYILCYCFKLLKAKHYLKNALDFLAQEGRQMKLELERLALRDPEEITKLLNRNELLKKQLLESQELRGQIAERMAASQKVSNKRILELEAKVKSYEEKKSQLEKGSALLQELKEKPRALSNGEFEDLAFLVDTTQSACLTRLKLQNSKLTKSSIWYCCLVCLDFSLQDIAVIFGIDKRSVSQRKQRVKKQLEYLLPEGLELEDYIKSF